MDKNRKKHGMVKSMELLVYNVFRFLSHGPFAKSTGVSSSSTSLVSDIFAALLAI